MTSFQQHTETLKNLFLMLERGKICIVIPVKLGWCNDLFALWRVCLFLRVLH